MTEKERKAALIDAGFTAYGAETYIKITKYNLGAFYDPFAGNVIIKKQDFTGDTKKEALRFIEENTGWVLGFEIDYYFITEQEA